MRPRVEPINTYTRTVYGGLYIGTSVKAVLQTYKHPGSDPDSPYVCMTFQVLPISLIMEHPSAASLGCDQRQVLVN